MSFLTSPGVGRYWYFYPCVIVRASPSLARADWHAKLLTNRSRFLWSNPDSHGPGESGGIAVSWPALGQFWGHWPACKPGCESIDLWPAPAAHQAGWRSQVAAFPGCTQIRSGSEGGRETSRPALLVAAPWVLCPRPGLLSLNHSAGPWVPSFPWCPVGPRLGPGDLSVPRIKPRSPTLQADSLLSEPSGKPVSNLFALKSLSWKGVISQKVPPHLI